jgi:ketosteroid isomerase-like protein
MIEKVMNALTEKDAGALAECFSEDCRYFDYCPSSNGEQNYFIYGRACIEMFFQNRFTFDYFEAGDPVIEDGNTASYFGAYCGPYVYARLRIEEYDDAGLIRKVVVHPA